MASIYGLRFQKMPALMLFIPFFPIVTFSIWMPTIPTTWLDSFQIQLSHFLRNSHLIFLFDVWISLTLLVVYLFISQYPINLEFFPPLSFSFCCLFTSANFNWIEPQSENCLNRSFSKKIFRHSLYLLFCLFGKCLINHQLFF